jgi:hypothetical protein
MAQMLELGGHPQHYGLMKGKEVTCNFQMQSFIIGPVDENIEDKQRRGLGRTHSVQTTSLTNFVLLM